MGEVNDRGWRRGWPAKFAADLARRRRNFNVRKEKVRERWAALERKRERESVGIADEIYTTTTLHAYGSKIIINAYGDIINMPAAVQLALHDQSIHTTTTPECAAEHMMSGMKIWAFRIDDPAHFYLVWMNSVVDFTTTSTWPIPMEFGVLILLPLQVGCGIGGVFLAENPPIMFPQRRESNVRIWWDLLACPLPEGGDYEAIISTHSPQWPMC